MDDPLLHHPHDHFVKATFTHPKRIAPVLKPHLPKAIAAAVDWESLQHRPGSFLDERLRERSSDLLFSARWKNSEVLFYVLFEHQKQEDRWMPLRLLRYMIAIWDRFRVDHPDTEKLPLIVPIVFHQSLKEWRTTRTMADLVDVPADHVRDAHGWIPDFSFQLIELQQAVVEKMGEHLVAEVAVKVLRSVLRPDPVDSLREGLRALRELAETDEHMEFLRICLTYLTNAGNDVDAEVFLEHISLLHSQKLEEQAMTIAESLISKGREEGREEGTLVGQRVLVRRLLEKRFGSIPAEIQDRLSAATLAELERWSERILEAPSVHDVFRPET